MQEKIVMDTNFLLIPGQLGVDIYTEMKERLDFPYELFIIKSTLDELDEISTKVKEKDRVAINIAKSLLKTKTINIIDYAGDLSVDDALVRLSEEGYIIATQDKKLRSRIKGKKIVLRQRKYIMVEN